MAAAQAGTLEGILAAHAWRNERRINAFRAAIWIGVGAITAGAELAAAGTASPGALLALAWGLCALVSGATWLARARRPWVGGLLAMIDITVLVACMQAGHLYLLANAPGLVPHQLHGSGVVLTALLASNMLRYSWRVSLASSLYGGAAYFAVLWLNDAVNVLTYVELAVIALLGLMLVYFARRLALIVRQVVERESLTRFLPPPVVERVVQDPTALDLAGEAQEVTALFADIRGFTALAEHLGPHAVVGLLREYFAEMAAEIGARGGIVMQYVGDNLYAVFPEKGGADHARRAVECALAMRRRLAALNEKRRARGQPPIQAGIGVHSGPVVAGSIGSRELLQYAYVGDTVNLASRIERLTRELGRAVLVSDETLQRAGGAAAFGAESMGEASVRGRRGTLTLWAL